MKSVLVVQPSLQPPGGGNLLAAWLIEALKGDHAVTLLTWWPVDLDEINCHCGTSLAESDVARLRVSALTRALCRVLPLPLALLKASLLLRAAKRIVAQYDVPISVNNEADLGRRAIQYVHFPAGYRPRPSGDLRWYHGSSHLLSVYYWLCERISGVSVERMKRNVTLTNSRWTAAKIAECYGIESRTVHPPCPGKFPAVSWEDREDGFVSIGRISPEKELDKVIDILAAVRDRGHDVHLHIIGTADNREYFAHIRERASRTPWIFLEENLRREALLRLVARHRYGIHGMSEEHFGIAIAEMIRAGCIVFVPRGGGAREIVDGLETSSYASPDEAVHNIVRVLDDEQLRSELRAELAARGEFFSTERFVRSIREIVEGF